MDEETKKQFEEQRQKLDAIYRSIERMKRYFFWMLAVSIAVIVLPLIGLLYAIPRFLDLYTRLGI